MYFEGSFHTMGVLPKSGFSEILRKSEKDSTLIIVAKRALKEALQYSLKGFSFFSIFSSKVVLLFFSNMEI